MSHYIDLGLNFGLYQKFIQTTLGQRNPNVWGQHWSDKQNCIGPTSFANINNVDPMFSPMYVCYLGHNPVIYRPYLTAYSAYHAPNKIFFSGEQGIILLAGDGVGVTCQFSVILLCEFNKTEVKHMADENAAFISL